MKNINLIGLMLCCIYLFSACSDDKTPEDTPEIFIPHMAEIASELSVFGNSLTEKAAFYLQNTQGEEFPMTDLKYALPKITFTVPETVPEGEYTLMLKQGNQTVSLGNVTTITKLIPVKRLKSVNIMGWTELAMEYDEHSRLKTVTTYSIEEQDKTMLEQYHFAYTDSQITISGDLDYTYSLTKERITSSSDGDLTYTWDYTDNYLTEISNEGEAVYSYQYDKGNLITTGNLDGMASFEYTDTQLTNDYKGIDMAIWYENFGLSDEINYVQLFAQLLGVSGNMSANLPTGMDAFGDISAFEYEWDEDHWITYADLPDWEIPLTFTYETVKIPNYLLK